MFCPRTDMSSIPSHLFLLVTLLTHLQLISAWGGDSSSSVDTTIYGLSYQREDWMYGSKTIALKYEGCVWGYVDDRENAGCMEDESEDGTTMWYMMANCKRAQVAYSVYASSGSTSCSNGDFKESVSLLRDIHRQLGTTCSSLFISIKNEYIACYNKWSSRIRIYSWLLRIQLTDFWR